MKKNNRILVFGNFGYLTNSINGQTLKTRSVYNLLNKNLLGEVHFFNQEHLYFKKKKIFILITEIIRCNKLIYIPALNNLKYSLPFLFLMSKLFFFKIIHIPVGGRHNDFLKRNRIHRFLLSTIQVNLPQTKKEVNELNLKFNYINVDYLPNFRIHDYMPLIVENKTRFFKICFMARVTPLKGIDAIIRLSNWLLLNPVKDIEVIIDFYGPIEEGYKDVFFNEIKNITMLNYLGVVQPTDIYSTFSNYDLSVLPTKYPGEGFPGSVLDSYISAVPVIVSKWRHLPEFVKHEKTGFIYNLDDEEEFYNYVKYLILNPKIVYNMKLNAFEESKLYSEKTAWEILNKHVVK